MLYLDEPDTARYTAVVLGSNNNYNKTGMLDLSQVISTALVNTTGMPEWTQEDCWLTCQQYLTDLLAAKGS